MTNSYPSFGQTNWYDQLKDYVDARVFRLEDQGAVGDGTTDDLAAINATLALMDTGDILHLTEGKTFAHSGVINVNIPGVWILGGTLKGLNSAHCAMYLLADGIRVSNVTKNVTWSTRTNTQDSHSFVLKGSNQILDHVEANGAGGVGIFAFGASDYLIDAPLVTNTGADGIHNTYGSTRGLIRSPRVYTAGDDHLAFVSYTGDPSPVSDVRATNAFLSCTGSTNGRGISVVGGQDIEVDGYKVIDSYGASVYVNCEVSFPARAIARIRLKHGEIIRPNTGWGTVSQGAILMGNSDTTLTVDDVEFTDLLVRDAGVTMGTGAGRVVAMQKNSTGAITNLSVDGLKVRGTLCGNLISNTTGGNTDAVKNVDYGRLPTSSLPTASAAVSGATYWDTTISAAGFCNGTTWVNYGVTTDPGFVKLGSNQSALNTTAVTAVGLSPSVIANATYKVTGFVIYDGSTTGDLKLSFTVPSGASLEWSGAGLGAGVSTLAGSFQSGEVTGGSNTQSFGGIAVGTKQYVDLFGVLTTVGNAGTLQLNFAQNGLDAVNATTIYAGSWLHVERVA